MKNIVNPLCQVFTDPRDPRQVLDPRPRYFLKATKLLEQALPAFWAQALNIFQHRRSTRFPSPLTMPSDCKTVGLVTNLLNKM